MEMIEKISDKIHMEISWRSVCINLSAYINANILQGVGTFKDAFHALYTNSHIRLGYYEPLINILYNCDVKLAREVCTYQDRMSHVLTKKDLDEIKVWKTKKEEEKATEVEESIRDYEAKMVADVDQALGPDSGKMVADNDQALGPDSGKPWDSLKRECEHYLPKVDVKSSLDVADIFQNLVSRGNIQFGKYEIFEKIVRGCKVPHAKNTADKILQYQNNILDILRKREKEYNEREAEIEKCETFKPDTKRRKKHVASEKSLEWSNNPLQENGVCEARNRTHTCNVTQNNTLCTPKDRDHFAQLQEIETRSNNPLQENGVCEARNRTHTCNVTQNNTLCTPKDRDHFTQLQEIETRSNNPLQENGVCEARNRTHTCNVTQNNTLCTPKDRDHFAQLQEIETNLDKIKVWKTENKEKKGAPAVLGLLQALRNGKEPIFRTRLMAIGPSGAGKTCMIKRLLQHNDHDEYTTDNVTYSNIRRNVNIFDYRIKEPKDSTISTIIEDNMGEDDSCILKTLIMVIPLLIVIHCLIIFGRKFTEDSIYIEYCLFMADDASRILSNILTVLIIRSFIMIMIYVLKHMGWRFLPRTPYKRILVLLLPIMCHILTGIVPALWVLYDLLSRIDDQTESTRIHVLKSSVMYVNNKGGIGLVAVWACLGICVWYNNGREMKEFDWIQNSALVIFHITMFLIMYTYIINAVTEFLWADTIPTRYQLGYRSNEWNGYHLAVLVISIVLYYVYTYWKCGMDLAIKLFRKDAECDTTDGISNSICVYKMYMAKQKPNVQVSVWDFNAVTQWHAMHQVFLSPWAIYLLVINLAKENKTENTDKTTAPIPDLEESPQFWLNSIHAYSTWIKKDTPSRRTEHQRFRHNTFQEDSQKLKPPVILVGTHKDKVEEKQIPDIFTTCRKCFIEKDQMSGRHLVDEEYAVDNVQVDDEGIKLLHNKIYDLTLKLGCPVVEIPESWWALERKLHEKKPRMKKVVSLDDILQVIHDYNISINDQDELIVFLKYQNNLGNIIYLSDFPQFIVLDMGWFINAIQYFITKHQPEIDRVLVRKFPDANSDLEMFCQCGMLSNRLIEAVLKMKGVSDYKDILLELMERFDIIAKATTHESDDVERRFDNYLVPCMIPKCIDESILSEVAKRASITPFLCFVFKAYFHPSIFHKLIAACIETYKVASMGLGKKLLLFYDCGIFDMDGSRTVRFALGMRDHILKLRVYQTGDSIPDLSKCLEVKCFIEEKLNVLLKLFQDSPFELCIMCQKSPTSMDAIDGLLPVNDLLLHKKVNCDKHDPKDAHCVRSTNLLKIWMDSKEYENLVEGHGSEDTENDDLERKKRELHADLLADLSGNLSTSEQNYIQFLMRLEHEANVPRADLADAKDDIYKIFKVMYRKGCMKHGDFAVLKELLKFDMSSVEIVEKYEEQFQCL